MFSLLIEAQPLNGQRATFLATAKMLRPELEAAPGFVDHTRYRSLMRDGWIVSLSGWRDEASVVGWHARRGDEAQENDWADMLADYRLRVGEVTSDTKLPDARKNVEERLNETGTYLTLIDARQTPEWVRASNPQEIALYLGFDLNSYGDCISWDVVESLSGPGEIMLMVTWKNAQSANDHAATQIVPDDARVRVVRVVRDYLPNKQVSHRDEVGGESIQA